MTAEELIQQLGKELTFDAKYVEEDEEWVLDLKLENGRRQELTVRPFEEEGEARVRFFTVVGSAAEFSQKKLLTALELNASLLYGAVAVYEGNIVLTETARLNYDPRDVSMVVRYVTRMADAYEKILFGVDRA